ncbi:hypothetical protein [Streptomyces sp. YIM S03343]
MSALDRLLAETIPTRPPHPPPRTRRWTEAEQDAHWAALCNAVGTPGAQRPRLRLVPPPEPADDLTDKEISQ